MKGEESERSVASSGDGLPTQRVNKRGACAGTGTIVSGSADHAGTINEGGTNSTTCKVTFGKVFSVAPFCVVTQSKGAIISISVTVATNELTINKGSNVNTRGYTWVCYGQ